MSGPLVPSIAFESRPGLTVCGTCGTEDGSVKILSLRWNDPNWKPYHGGGTAVALCGACRGLLFDLLNTERAR